MTTHYNQAGILTSQADALESLPSANMAAPSRALMWTYLLQLLLPLLLLLDYFHAVERATAEPSDRFVGIAAALWLTVGFGAWLVFRNRRSFYRSILGPLVGVYTVVFCLVGFELGARVLIHKPLPAVWRPGSKYVLKSDTKAFPGVSPVAHFSVNELGLRGPLLPRNTPSYKIVTIGGSTTLCLLLDDGKTWPDLLMQQMNERQKRIKVWVANAGVNGHTAVHHLIMLRGLQSVYQDNLFIFLPGINDLQYTLGFHGGPTDNFLSGEAARFERQMNSGGENPYPFYRRLRTYQLFRKSLDKLVERTTGIQRNEVLDEIALRKQRAQGAIAPMPDLTVGITEYRGRIHRLGEACKNLQVGCLFLTQPNMWRGDLSMQEKELLLFGWLGRKDQPDAYVAVSDLATAITSYNRALLDVCKEEHLQCLDLAGLILPNTSNFYDDVHFNEGGAATVARVIADRLLQRPSLFPPERN